MFAGHFGLAAVVKAAQPKVPLWSLMIGTQLLDILFIPLFMTGVETMESIGEGSKQILIHAPFSHSLVSTLLLSLLAGWLAWRAWGRRSGVVIGATVFSHWLLDLLVHRPDIPILPGNAGQLPLLGLGLWEWPLATMMVEGALIAAGSIAYFRYALSRNATALSSGHVRSKKKGFVAGTVMAVLLTASFVMDL